MTDLPKHDLDAEAAVLSTLLLAGEDVRARGQALQAMDLLEPDDFFLGAHRRTFEAIRAVENTPGGGVLDVVTVAHKLREMGRDQEVGGTPFLAALCEATPAVANVLHHARLVADTARVRRAGTLLARLSVEARQPIGDYREWLDSVEARVTTACNPTRRDDRTVNLQDGVAEVYEMMRAARERPDSLGAPTGIRPLDRFTGGMLRGNVWTIAGRYGMGKTAFSLQCLVTAGEAKHGGVFLSGEMPREQLTRRALGRMARVQAKMIRSGTVAGEDWQRLSAAAERLRRLPILIDDVPQLTPSGVRAAFRRHSARLRSEGSEMRVVVIDNVQLCGRDPDGPKGRTEQLDAFTRELKSLAKEHQCCVLQLSQLQHTNSGERPKLSDVRGSGQIVADSDVVLMIHRPGYYGDESAGDLAELILAKGRDDGTGIIETDFTAPIGDFKERRSVSEDVREGAWWDN